jgi:acetyl-CoA carboxylase carboxyl transferase subunit alpha
MRELEFERPVLELERQIEALRRQAAGRDRLSNLVDPDTYAETPTRRRARRGRATPEDPDLGRARLDAQIARLEERAARLRERIFAGLTPWQTVQVARHPQRPFALDHVARMFTDFVELHGDRAFGDDPAIVGGLARLEGRPVLVLAHQKGRSTSENLLRNFGMPRPEGYRKAARLMGLAARFGLPIVSLIDTPGAYPGIEAEARGQAQAIAECLEAMASLPVPVVAAVIGEGGSGGALALGVANRILILEHAIYSVISPEGCASILFKDAAHAAQAAAALRLTAPDLLRLAVVDEVVPEGPGGAHRDPAATSLNLRRAIAAHLATLDRLGPDDLREDRYRRFRQLGALAELTPPAPRAAPRRPAGSSVPPAEDPAEGGDAPAVADTGPLGRKPRSRKAPSKSRARAPRR